MADGLVLLSDVDGFYSADPRSDPDAEFFDVVESIDDRHVAMAGASGTQVGSGGMNTKVQAARIATHAGCATMIASGAGERPLGRLSDGSRHTLFPAAETPAAIRKQWLAGVLDVKGELRLDDGAVAALQGGKSLLPVGVVDVVGRFERGDAVTLAAADGRELGRGLTAYPSDEAAAIKGCRSAQIEDILGYRGRDVMVHRDDMVLFDRQ
jgi:glutamate 5-kinase